MLYHPAKALSLSSTLLLDFSWQYCDVGICLHKIKTFNDASSLMFVEKALKRKGISACKISKYIFFYENQTTALAKQSSILFWSARGFEYTIGKGTSLAFQNGMSLKYLNTASRKNGDFFDSLIDT